MNQLAIDFRDAGIRTARDHAEAESPGWTALALGYLKEFCCYNQEFLAEDVREYALSRGFKTPSGVSSRCWGGVMQAGARKGLIRKAGARAVRNAKAHLCYATLWQTL